MPYGVYEKNGKIYMNYSSNENTIRKTENDEKLLGIFNGENDAKEFFKKYMSENPRLKYLGKL